LRVHGAAAFEREAPDPECLQALLDRREPPVRVTSGRRLRVVPQTGRPRAFEDRYEPRVYLRGEIQVRQRSWHDGFNVLVWLAFPRAKAALNARHYAALREQAALGAPNRGPTQDALTLFDEGGVVVASADRDLLDMVGEFRWRDLFWVNRERVRRRARFFVFGHALYEKLLQPFAGVTGRGMLLEVESGWLDAPLEAQLATIDSRTAAWLSDPGRLRATRELAVVPVLGVPGWHAGNEDESFYDDADYFRPGRLREA
jgi:hypothetical protein